MRIEINTKPARKKQEGIDYPHLSCKKYLLAPSRTSQDHTKYQEQVPTKDPKELHNGQKF